MNNYSYILEPYKGLQSRHRCPNCGQQRQFARYVDCNTGEYLSDLTGKCNRLDKCGYHYTPKQYFADYPININAMKQGAITFNNVLLQNRKSASTHTLSHKPISDSTYSVIPNDLFYKSLRRYDGNNFTLGLERLFGTLKTLELIDRFDIGTAKYPANGTIFWQVDTAGMVRTGKIMRYDAITLKRVKQLSAANKNQRDETKINDLQQHVVAPLVDWVHSRLKRKGVVKDYMLQQCLFGLHQLATTPKNDAIAIVESEKTAVIASVYMPNLVWMATGGAQNFNNTLLKPLAGRKVIVFPDVNQYQYWKTKANNIQQQLQMDINVSDFMEVNASDSMKISGADLADVLIKRDADTGIALTDGGYPLGWI